MSDLQTPNHQPSQGYAPQGFPPGWAPQSNQLAYPDPAQFVPGFEPQHSKPGTVVAASVMWIIYGGLGLLGNLFTLANGVIGTSTLISISLALLFLITGIQAVAGKARSVLGVGITSIILGALVGIAFLALGSMFRNLGGGGIFLAIGMLLGGYLITAGVLACMGNQKYKNWRMTKGLY